MFSSFISSHISLILLAFPLSLLSPILRNYLGIAWAAAFLSRLWYTLSNRLDRSQRPLTTRMMRGVIVLCLWLGVALLVGTQLPPLFIALAYQYAPYFALILLACALDVGRILTLIPATRALKNATLPLAVSASLSRLIGAPVQTLDVFGARRVSIEAVADILCIRVFGGMFTFLLGGWSLLLPWLTLTLIMRSTMQNTGAYSATPLNFSWAASHLWHIARSLLSLPLLVFLPIAAIFVPRTSPLRAIRGIIYCPTTGLSFMPPPRLLNGVSCATRIALGGPLIIAGVSYPRLWLGADATAQLSAADTRRANLLILITFIISLLIMCLLILMIMAWPFPNFYADL